ncbi:hypothetical protein K503DRAFT_628846 [Rhizopogon vinicolor AM-OR11-026]|uniref:Uncharacterized protein n=1 Tax=Rhizopogon vinicolor AM-OR11-026 TaxID=1314800 RepID=A0A1B7N629_9AGAM|nr:hypothetical protein K503DRAFT_628846 [Rhizopogon vinicolor AM-OR11-026]
MILPFCPHLSCCFAPCLGTPFRPYYISHGDFTLPESHYFGKRVSIAQDQRTRCVVRGSALISQRYHVVAICTTKNLPGALIHSQN